MTHYVYKREVKAQFGRYLEENGWNLYGWKKDQSDPMTDYYDPASWSGIATKGGYVLAVDISEYDVKTSSGRIPEHSVQVDDGPCEHCNGSGDDPSGWTLEKARANPREYNAWEAGPGRFMLLQDVVSPIPFNSSGKLKCKQCHGTGKRTHIERVQELEKQWPTFQPNPPRRVWHIEKDGKILGSGTGLWSLALKTRAEQSEGFSKLLQRIENCIKPTPTPIPLTASEAAPSVSDGTRPGYIEVRFGEKPPKDVLVELKRSGYRWSPNHSCWYGLRSRYPFGA